MFLLASWALRGSSEGTNFGVSPQMRRRRPTSEPSSGDVLASLYRDLEGVEGGILGTLGTVGLTLRRPQLLHDALGRSLLGPRAGLHYLVAAAWLAKHMWGLQRRLPLGCQIQVLLSQVRTQLPDLKLQEAEGLQVGMLARVGAGWHQWEGQGPG